MSSEYVPPDGLNSEANPAPPSRWAARPRAIVPADANDVMREQLEYLIEHAGDGHCGCPQCDRYLRARSLLMEIFTEAKKPAAITSLVSGASMADIGH